MTYAWRALTPDDVDAWAGLLRALAVADGTDEMYSPQDLLEEFDSPTFDPRVDAMSVWSGDSLVAWSGCYCSEGRIEDAARVFQDGGVHPEHRGRGLGRALFDWTETRAAALRDRRHPGADLLLAASGLSAGSAVSTLLEHRGYAPVRYFSDLRVDLATWDDPGLPSSAVAFTQTLSEPTMHAHHDAFRDHWGYAPGSPESWRHQAESRTARPEQSFVVVASDGQVDAYALCSEWEPGELYVNIVGTRRRARGRGLARQCLVSVLRAAREADYRVVDLTVDSASATGANRLYESLGFVEQRTLSRYWKRVPATA